MVPSQIDAVVIPAQQADFEPFTPAAVWRRLRSGCRWAIENWLTVSILLYVYVTVIGLAFAISFQLKTGIDALYFYDPTDFLLAGLRHPAALVIPVVVFLLFLIFGLIYQFMYTLLLWFIERYKKYNPDIAKNKHINIILKKLTYTVRGWFYLEFYMNLLVLLGLIVFVPFLAMQYFETCGQSASILLRADAIGEADAGKSLSGTIVGSMHTMLLLENNNGGDFRAIPMDGIREVIVSKSSPRSNIAKLGCMLIQ
jgi:hypothetical protein